MITRPELDRIGSRSIVALVLLVLVGLTPDVYAQPGLVSWWPAEGSADDVFGGNDGTLQGGVTFGPGRVGQGFTFQGVAGERVVVPHSPELSLESLPTATVEGWFRWTGPQSHPTTGGFIVGKHACGFGNGWLVSVTLGVMLDGSSLVGDLGFGGRNVSDGQWHHFAGVKDGSTYYEYLDGVLTGTSAANPHPNTNTAALQIGGISGGTCNNSDQFTGVIDEIRIHHRALSASEIQAIASGTVPPSPETELAQCEADLADALAQIDSLSAENARLQGDLAAAQSALGTVEQTLARLFSNPQFRIPGNTVPEQLDALVSAIVRLNRGRQEGLYVNLGGTLGH